MQKNKKTLPLPLPIGRGAITEGPRYSSPIIGEGQKPQRKKLCNSVSLCCKNAPHFEPVINHLESEIRGRVSFF